jgi:NADH:ubiquinone oxidoreductase subunit F (NADH-binding)/NADH:ubiquinone oxidoreductase subunit E
MSDNISALSGRKGLDNNLFEQLVESSKDLGTPSPEQLNSLAKEFLLGTAVTHGAASFYDFLKPDHQGKKVHVCNGSACLLAGTQDNVKEKLAEHFKPEEVGHMCCLGRCHENSAFNLGENNYSGRDIEAIAKIIEGDSKIHRNDEYKVYSECNSPVLTGRKMQVGDFAFSFRQVLNQGADWALQQIKQANIRGRGGAGFPMGFKLESCKNTSSDQKYIVCNADEGDPGAYSDRYLLEQQPLSVLFGMMVAGYIIGANRGVLYIRGEYPESIEIINKAISELERAGLHGEDILATDFNFRFKVIEGAGAYICGEETALLASIEGQRPEVRVRPPYPTQEGLFLKPTVVNNVETLAAIPWIIAQGGKKYADLGTDKSTGTKLVCLDSFVKNPGVYEVEMGASFQELIYNEGGGFVEPIKALHVGGPLGGIVPTQKIPELTVDFESFEKAGFLMGHAGVVAIPESYPMIKYLEHLFEFTADESCGKCFPCSIGSVRGKEMMSNAHVNAMKIDRNLLDDLLETLEIGSLCALGGGLPLGVKNALEYFEDELNEYFK